MGMYAVAHLSASTASLAISVLGATVLAALAHGQAAIPFENNGLHYRALTRGGMTIVIAKLNTRVRGGRFFKSRLRMARRLHGR